LDEIAIKHQHIHLAQAKSPERFPRRIHDRLPFKVEGGVEDYRHSSSRAEKLNKLIISWSCCSIDRLKPACSIDMSNSGNGVSLVLPDIDDIEHKASRIVMGRLCQVKKLPGPLDEHRRGRRSVRLTKLNLCVHDILHLRSPWVSEDATVP